MQRQDHLTLVCFGVTHESASFAPWARHRPGLALVLTGMGQANADAAIREALARHRPGRVISSGFAGGLDPALATGTVVFDAADAPGLGAPLRQAGAVAASFHCAATIAVTPADKEALRARSGAGAVEMESQVIRDVCREAGVPCATVRSISDAAHEALPLDFNQLMTPRMEIDYWRLAGTIARKPWLIASLLAFQKRTRQAEQNLARVLRTVLA